MIDGRPDIRRRQLLDLHVLAQRCVDLVKVVGEKQRPLRFGAFAGAMQRASGIITPMQAEQVMRLRIVIRGAVQGVGFRPFIYRLATEMGLTGWVINNAQGVFIEVEGSQAELDAFLLRIEPEKPPHAIIQSLEAARLDAAGFTTFEIRHSEDAGHKTALVLPDLATCPDCRREIFDPANRRFGYPFTNCTNCGPRYSIIEALPYDRPNTAMRIFQMCPACQAEYNDPRDRRFHAQPNACPVCGPRLELWDANGHTVGSQDQALRSAAEAIREGRIVAAKGLGGFHLIVDARNDDAVRVLRRRKQREEKPFALMLPWAHGPEAGALRHVEALCHVNALEARLLRSAESPIVLLRRRADSAGAISPAVAPPPNPYLGVMLPYTPLHHLLMAELGFPVVATSGNLSDEPICIDEHEALQRLAGIADLFLVHDRPIVRHVDDSIVRVVAGREMMVRRARGYAPLPVRIGQTTDNRQQTTDSRDVAADAGSPLATRHSSLVNPKSILAVGAHLKNTIALAIGDNVFISQHIGDLETAQAYEAFCRVIDSLSRLYAFTPDVVACDLHPDYLSTHFAETYTQERGLPLMRVQHHLAHVAACMAENDLDGPALGVAWDGTGYGLDGTIWGGEFLRVMPTGIDAQAGLLFERVGHLRPFRLPGGDLAVKEPRRVALGVLFEMFGDAVWQMTDLPPVAAFAPAERALLRQTLKQHLNAPLTTSAGRLFDAVASLAGLRQHLNYEGQAAMALEFAIDDLHTDEAYPFSILDWGIANSRFDDAQSKTQNAASRIQIDWAPLIQAVIDDTRALNRQASIGDRQLSVLAARFHNALAEMVIAVARRVNEPRVVLTGGCFQNCYLLERVVQRLRDEGFRPYWHQRVPPNDGGIALGQAAAARWHTADDRQQMADNRWQTADGR